MAKMAKIYVIKKQISGKFFGQTGFQPPQVGNIFRAKKAQNSGKMAGPQREKKICLATFFFKKRKFFWRRFFLEKKILKYFFGDVFF